MGRAASPRLVWSWSWAIVVLYWRVYVMLCAAQCSGMRPRRPGPWRTGRGGTWIQIQSSGITPACDELASRATPMPRESSSDLAHFLQELLDARWTTMVEFIDQEKNIISGFDCCSLFSPVAFLCFTVANDSKYLRETKSIAWDLFRFQISIFQCILKIKMCWRLMPTLGLKYVLEHALLDRMKISQG